jgi:hypothetical protein
MLVLVRIVRTCERAEFSWTVPMPLTRVGSGVAVAAGAGSVTGSGVTVGGIVGVAGVPPHAAERAVVKATIIAMATLR